MAPAVATKICMAWPCLLLGSCRRALYSAVRKSLWFCSWSCIGKKPPTHVRLCVSSAFGVCLPAVAEVFAILGEGDPWVGIWYPMGLGSRPGASRRDSGVLQRDGSPLPHVSGSGEPGVESPHS